MGKPFMIEEFGKEVHLESGAQANITSIRGPFYRKVYQQLQESLAADGPLKGVTLRHSDLNCSFQSFSCLFTFWGGADTSILVVSLCLCMSHLCCWFINQGTVVIQLMPVLYLQLLNKTRLVCGHGS